LKQADVAQILKEIVDGKKIFGASLLRNDGKVIADHYVGAKGALINLVARDSLGSKRRRRDVFPILGKIDISITMYDKLSVGLVSVDKDKYIQLAAKPELSMKILYGKLRESSRKIRSSIV
jgi:hypothetical protein